MLRTSLFCTLSLVAGLAGATDIKGAGSVVAQPLYVALVGLYVKTDPMGFNYQGNGSADGMKQLKAGNVDFATADVAVSVAQRKADNLICFPISVSGVIPVVNLPGLHKGQLKLTGDELADIFARKIVKWNDTRLKADNPGVNLPDLAITVVVRADGAGTTYNFTDYLSKASPAWASTYGRDLSIKWAAGTVPAKGNPALAQAVRETPGAISYADALIAAKNDLNFAMLKNHDGKFVAPGAASFSAALARSTWTKRATYEDMLTDLPGAGSWPITSGAFIIVPQKSLRPAQTIAALKFFTWGLIRGGAAVGQADYVTLPDNVQGRIFGELTTITDSAGAPLAWSLADVMKLR